MTKTILAGLIGLLLGGFGTAAEAASCPAAPPAQIVFDAVPSPLPQDTSASAKDLSIKLGATDDTRRAAGFYDANYASGARRETAIAKLPDGTVCAAVSKLTVKISFERKLWLASELTADQCVLNAFANAYGARGKADDAAVAEFTKTMGPTYQAQLAAIGWQSAPSQDAAMKAVGDKIAPMLTDIETKFLAIRAAAQAKVDLSHLPPEECDGATAKIGRTVGFPGK